MGGGLFATELALNPKCLVFSAFVLGVYWLPHPVAFSHRIVMNFILACLAYVLLAWYDMLYSCTDQFKPTLLGWMWKGLKPQSYSDKYDALPEREKKIIRTVDIIILVVLVALLAYPFFVKSR
jgi:UDP-N-acetylmuramyl pentapeptide phosphotransferase/UDP-N-acetylglucosamine-1-phosphate transferase